MLIFTFHSSPQLQIVTSIMEQVNVSLFILRTFDFGTAFWQIKNILSHLKSRCLLSLWSCNFPKCLFVWTACELVYDAGRLEHSPSGEHCICREIPVLRTQFLENLCSTVRMWQVLKLGECPGEIWGGTKQAHHVISNLIFWANSPILGLRVGWWGGFEMNVKKL